MALKVKKAARADIPEGATHGFKVVDGHETVMFFHWHNDGGIDMPLFLPGDVVPEGHDPDAKARQQRTSYADVLAVLPDRLEGMGYGADVDGILGEVVGMFGAG